MRAWLALTVLLAACGGGSESVTPGPSPVPTPVVFPPPVPPPVVPPPTSPGVTITGAITNTVTGHVVGEFSQEVASLPAQIMVGAAGHVSRETWVSSATPTVDLFPEAGFSLQFYRQFARDDFDRYQGELQILRVLPSAPAFYIEVDGAKGLSAQIATRLEAVARRVVPALTGGRFQVTRWETGPTAREPQSGWIVIERRDDRTACGRALVGASAGHIWLDGDQQCRIEFVFAHEIGHALGFWHVDRPGSLMFPQERLDRSAADAPTDTERHHAALAYARVAGNRDIDRDPERPASLSTSRVVID